MEGGFPSSIASTAAAAAGPAGRVVVVGGSGGGGPTTLVKQSSQGGVVGTQQQQQQQQQDSKSSVIGVIPGSNPTSGVEVTANSYVGGGGGGGGGMVNHVRQSSRRGSGGSSTGGGGVGNGCCDGLDRLGKSMNLIVEIFATIGETIGDENEEIRSEMLDACREARSLGAGLEKTCYLGSQGGTGPGPGPTVPGRK